MILWQFLFLNLLYILPYIIYSLINYCSYISEYFLLDGFSLLLSCIPCYIIYSLFFQIEIVNSFLNQIFMYLSCLSSVLCFISNNLIVFFIAYELSIILLLFSLFINSPYSERNLAGWYFLGYLVFSGVPLLLLIVYLSMNNTCINLLNNNNILSVLLFLIFITKVPLFPFHAWLPIVHAEANSFVSIMLSGYIMKLGLLGLIRFFGESYESLKIYLFIFFFFSCLCFVSCFCELDNKRWLAFLSLGHISIGVLGIFILPIGTNNVISSFSLGHGLSVFILFFYFYNYSNLSGSRSWVINILYNNNISNIILILGIFSLLSLPPCILFYNEIIIFIYSCDCGVILLIFCLYLFLSILSPVSNISVLISRLNGINLGGLSNYNLLVIVCSIYYFFIIFIVL